MVPSQQTRAMNLEDREVPNKETLGKVRLHKNHEEKLAKEGEHMIL